MERIGSRLARVIAWSAAVVVLHAAAAPVVRAQLPRHVSYAVRALDGSSIRIGAGEQATLVAVFATWCTSCRGEFATLDSLRRSLAPRGVRVIALSVDAREDVHVRRWADARHTGLIVAHDGSGAVGRTFGTVGVPESYLVDTRGIVRWRAEGEIGGELAGLRNALSSLRGARR